MRNIINTSDKGLIFRAYKVLTNINKKQIHSFSQEMERIN